MSPVLSHNNFQSVSYTVVNPFDGLVNFDLNIDRGVSRANKLAEASLFQIGKNLSLTNIEAAKPEIEVERTAKSIPAPESEAHAAVIHVWEGVVLSVDDGAMVVKLEDRSGNLPPHQAEISLEWVVDQDKDLVQPGAVFYWSIFKETRRGSIRNAEEIRFRRLPSWSKAQIAKIAQDAQMLRSKIRAPKKIDE